MGPAYFVGSTGGGTNFVDVQRRRVARQDGFRFASRIQLAKNIFGTQARPLTAPSWLDGSLFINDVISISLIRIAIFVLAALFLFVLFYVLLGGRPQ